jgi:glutamate---cysteine ligase / carboxylate-amine ligase
VEVNFGRREPFTLGIEEELQLVDAETYELSSRIDEILDRTGEDAQVKPELLQSVVEVATTPCRTVDEALEETRTLRARLRDAGAADGTLIAGAGTHPFSRYEHQQITERPRYRELLDEMRWVAERELIFGLHVHVGMATAGAAIGVANALRTRLPELLALSANSPFWQGRETGLDSTRLKLFDSFPRSGLPPAFASWDEFRALVERAARTNSFPDHTFIWWDLRPHPKLGTIEIRICDVQTRLASTGALAALVQALAATLAETLERDGRLLVEDATLVAENRWRAVRRGLDAELIWFERDEERPAREAVRELVELARPAARKLGGERALDEVERICERGTGADEQRREREERGSLLGVAQWLTEQTVADL